MFTQDDALAMIKGADARHVMDRALEERGHTVATMVSLLGRVSDDSLTTLAIWTRAEAEDGSERSIWLLPYLETELASRGLSLPRSHDK